MKTNKMLPDSSISKVWENFRKMNGIILTFVSTNWVAQSDGTFTNTVEYEGFTSDSILEVDLYDDGNLTETQISEYDGYITELNVEDGKIVAIATTLPTQPIKIICRGEIVGEKVIVNGGGSSDINASNMSCLDKDGQTSNVQKELDEQNKKFNDNYKLLWENPSPTSAFSPQTINLDLSQYKRVIIDCNYATNYAYVYSFNFSINNSGKCRLIFPSWGGSAVTFTARMVTILETGLVFEKAEANGSTVNENAIPIAIYGVY